MILWLFLLTPSLFFSSLTGNQWNVILLQRIKVRSKDVCTEYRLMTDLHIIVFIKNPLLPSVHLKKSPSIELKWLTHETVNFWKIYDFYTIICNNTIPSNNPDVSFEWSMSIMSCTDIYNSNIAMFIYGVSFP